MCVAGVKGCYCGDIVKSDRVRDACEDVCAAVDFLDGLVDTSRDKLIMVGYMGVLQAIAELTSAVIDYDDPEAGLESV